MIVIKADRKAGTCCTQVVSKRDSIVRGILSCKAKMQYLLTFQVSRYCLLASQSRIHALQIFRNRHLNISHAGQVYNVYIYMIYIYIASLPHPLTPVCIVYYDK